MRPALLATPLLVATLSAGCFTTTFGHPFPSPDARAIVVGKTGKTELQRLYGGWGAEETKDLSVRFNADGTVKSYAFTSNFPTDMKRLK